MTRTRFLRTALTIGAVASVSAATPSFAFAEIPAETDSSITSIPSQPVQAISGPGGSTPQNARMTVTSGGIGSSAWYVFEPAAPTPATAPVAVITHGYFEFGGYEMHRALIEHTVAQGNIVVYPRYQDTPVTACPGPFDIEPCIQSETAGITGALNYLESNPDSVQPDTDRTSYFGHSFGGIITTNITNRYRELGLPKPRAIFLDDPHDSGYAGPNEPALDDDLSGIPDDVVFQCYVGASGVIGEPGKQNASCNSIFPKLGHIPDGNKDLILSYDDEHGSPALSSNHGVSQGGGPVVFLPEAPVDAYDHKIWQLWDALRNYAYTDSDANYAVGDSTERRSNGYWSDGTPIVPLKIQKTSPIVP